MTTTETTTKPERVTLFSIHESIIALIDRFEDESDTEVSPEEIAAQLGVLEGQLEDKVAGCISYLRGQETLAQGLKAEADRLRSRAQVHENRARRMKEALMYVLDSLGRSKIETTRGTVRVQASGGKAALEVLVPAEALPAVYQRTVVEVDTERLRETLESNDTFMQEQLADKARLKPRGRHVVIK